MDTSPVHTIYDIEFYTRLLELETHTLSSYIASLSDDAWSHETACAKWDVSTVVAHLSGAVQAFAERIARGIGGDVSAPSGLPEAGEVNASSWAEANAVRWTSIRERTKQSPLEAFNETAGEFNRLVAGLRPGDLDKLCYHPGGVVPVRTLIGFRLLELSIHRWDIQSKLEPCAHLSPELIPTLIEFFSNYLKWFFVPGEPTSNPLCYRFDFTGDNLGAIDIVITGDSALMERAEASIADISFHCSAESFVLLICGRVSIESLKSNTLLLVDGNNQTELQFNQWFRGA